MPRRFLTGLDLAQNELLNARLQNLGGDPATPVAGQIYYRTTDNTIYVYNGTAWVALATGTVADASPSAKGVIQLAGDLAGTATSPQIAPGVITDAEIAAGAAIAMAKLAVNPVVRANHTGTQLAATVSDFDTQVRLSRLDQLAAPTALVSVNSQRITNLADPTAAQDAATKAYVDATLSGLDVKASVRAASTANVNIASPGTTLDGVTLANGERVLLKDQTTGSQNGIYVFNGSASNLTRAADADTSVEVTPGMFTFVEEGTANADTGWVLTTNAPIILGTTALVFTQFSGAGQITAGNGLAKTGNTLDVNVDAASIEINADILRVKAAGITNAMLAGGVDLTSKVTGTLPIANGGTGGATAAAARTALSAVGKYAVSIGNGAATAFTVNHALGTTDVQCQLWETGGGKLLVEAEVAIVDANNITVTFASAPATNAYRAVVMG